MAHPFHQASIPHKTIGEMIHDRKLIAIELSSQGPLGQGHPNRIGEPLTKWSSGRLNTGRVTKFGMPRRSRVELSKCLQILDSDIVAREVKKAVNQH